MKVTLLLTSLMIVALGTAHFWTPRPAATDAALASPTGEADLDDVLARKAALPTIAPAQTTEFDLRQTGVDQRNLDETRQMLRVLNGAK